MRMLTKVRFLSWVSCSFACLTHEELAEESLVHEIRAIGTPTLWTVASEATEATFETIEAAGAVISSKVGEAWS